MCTGLVLAQTVYTWTDAQGQHFTDDLSTVPRHAKVKKLDDGGPFASVGRGSPARMEEAPPAPGVDAGVTADAGEDLPLPPTGPASVRLTGVNARITAADLEYVRASIERGASSPRLKRFGTLHGTISVTIEDGHGMSREAFGEATGYETIHLRTPEDLMNLGGWPLPYDLTVTHELAHLLEHQVAGFDRPRWFAEGFASFVGERLKFSDAHDVAYFVVKQAQGHPLRHIFVPGAKVQLSYQVAQDLVTFLDALVGDDGIRRMFALRKRGQTFEQAFATVSGLSLEQFEAKFVDSVRPDFYERAE